MPPASLHLLGLGAAMIEAAGRRIFVDACNTYQQAPALAAGDLLLFTHNDGDHFCPHKAAQAAATHANDIIGPPGIAYPLLAEAGLPTTQLRIVYPPQPSVALELMLDEVKLTVWQTRHFIGWEPDHISYLVEIGGRSLYFTGDSHDLATDDSRLRGLDALVYSLVARDVIDGKLAGTAAAEYHLRELQEVQRRHRPCWLVPNHLIDCTWTADPVALRQAVEAQGLGGIAVMESAEQRLTLN